LKHTKKVIQYSDIAGIELHYYSLEDAIFNQLMEAVEENNQNSLRMSLDRMFVEFQEKHYAPEAIKSVIVQFVQRIIRTVRSMEGNERELASLDVVTVWHDHNITLDELRRIIETFAQEAAILVSQLYRAGKGGIYQIKRYIDQNFHRNINLKGIANHFYMNSAYLGQLFKKNYGVYFNEYVLQLRITAAKELLRKTDMRNYEIAEKIGFNNVDYFVSQFEKLEQMTPKEYRNRMNQR
jgi:two-component system response regulator YesN